MRYRCFASLKNNICDVILIFIRLIIIIVFILHERLFII